MVTVLNPARAMIGHGAPLIHRKARLTRSPGADARPASAAYVSIGALSRATGVPVETLRTWEIRYGFPKPVRKPSGHRQFEIAHIERIRRISHALKRGLRAGEVVAASDLTLQALLETVPAKHPMEEPSPLAAEALLDVLRRLDGEDLMRSLRSSRAIEHPLDYIETSIVPCLQIIGSAWEKGELDIAHEHFASERISDILRDARLHFEKIAEGAPIVLTTLPGEEHGLGLQMAALILAATRLRVLVLGTEVPVIEVAAVAQTTRARAVAVSISGTTARTSAPAIQALRAALPHNVELVLGGTGAPPNIKGTTTVVDFRSLHEWASKRVVGPS